MALRCILTTAVILGKIAGAIPTIAFPFNSQVPPIARVNEPFSYTFSSSTFSSTLPLSYTLSSAPSWLSLDSNTRTLSGTPTSNDVGKGTVTGVDIGLIASDTSGSVTSNATIVISRNPAPAIDIPLSSQLSSFGAIYSTPATLFYHPSTPFKFNFNPSTFSDDAGSSSLIYYATTDDNSPLPAWISFDATSLSFSGQTPDYASLIEPPQTWGLKLVASDVEGFSGPAIAFSIEVGVHLFAFKNEYMVVNASSGVEFSFDAISSSIELDGQQAASTSLAYVVAGSLPPWLHFDNSTLTLSGNPPKDAISTNISLQATDKYGDNANATIYVDVNTSLFTNMIGTLNATIGSSFSYNLSSYLRHPQDVSMTVETSPTVPWVSFDSQTFNLSGRVPSDLQLSQLTINLNATSKSSQISASQSLKLSLVAASEQPSTAASPTPTPTTMSSSHTGASDSAAIVTHKGLSRGIIAAIVVPIVVVVLLLLALLAILCYRRKSRSTGKYGPKGSKGDESPSPEVGSSIVDIEMPAPVAPPEPLPLDTSGFGDESGSSIYTTDLNRRSTRSNVDDEVRRSRTISAMSTIPMSQSKHSESLGNSGRAYSENTLFRNENHRRSTPDSTCFTLDSRANPSQRLSRVYSNYSRKGHTRRSGRVFSTDQPLQDKRSSSQPSESTVLSLKDSNFTSSPGKHLSVISTSIPENPEGTTSNNKPAGRRKSRRNSTFISPIERVSSGAGHGTRDSFSSFPGGNPKRRSAGHGQDWAAVLARESRIWQTASILENERNRRSVASNITDSSEKSRRNSAHQSNMSSYPGPKSAALSRLSQSSVNSRPRPISRRLVGQSPFLSGRASGRLSRRSPTRVRNSFADSPTVPEDDIMGNLSSPRTSDLPQDENANPHGLAYASPQEGTKQLRSYIQSRMQRARDSMRSIESNDSRFESASPSMQSMHKNYNSMETHDKGDAEKHRPNEEDYEEYIPDDDSEDSWETEPPNRDSQSDIIIYGAEDPSDAAMPISMHAALRSNPVSPPSTSRMPGLESHTRMGSGRGKTPVGINTKGKGSVTTRVERIVSGEDYRAYI